MSIVIDKETAAKVIGSRRKVKYNINHFCGYSKIIDSSEYVVYERPYKVDKIVAAYGDVIVKQHGNNKLIYYPDARITSFCYRVKLNSKNFPRLQKDSHISQCILIPYLRLVKQDTYVRDVRLCIITDKGQIYHNKPARDAKFEGYSKRNDVIHFEESVVWDIPGRKYPTNQNTPKEHECYYPGLPEICYKYSPISNNDSEFVDTYGNGGFSDHKICNIDGESIVCSRFYKYATKERSNPFFFIGTGNRNDKMSLIGTYRANIDCGVRICIFASSDGGREWFCKYEFSDVGEYTFQQGYTDVWGTNWGNSIAINNSIDCGKKEFYVYKRNLVLPNIENGEIETEFTWDICSKINKIYGKDKTIIQTEKPHGLKTGNIVSLKSNDSLPNSIEWLNCERLDGKGSAGGIQFKVRKIDECSIEILEMLSSQTPTLPCRHIHHINTMKDGWIVGTGEIFPNGWLLFISQKKADTFSVVSAADKINIVRLNTKSRSVQRTMGAIIKDTFENDLVFASDHDTLERRNCDGLLGKISRGSTGVFVGRLDNIDDRDNYECVYEAFEPCYFFQQIQDMLVFAGQRGELAICTDPKLKKWKQERLSRFIMYYMGYYHNYHIFNDYVILRK